MKRTTFVHSLEFLSIFAVTAIGNGCSIPLLIIHFTFVFAFVRNIGIYFVLAFCVCECVCVCLAVRSLRPKPLHFPFIFSSAAHSTRFSRNCNVIYLCDVKTMHFIYVCVCLLFACFIRSTNIINSISGQWSNMHKNTSAYKIASFLVRTQNYIYHHFISKI